MQQAFLEQDIGFTFITVLSTANYCAQYSQLLTGPVSKESNPNHAKAGYCNSVTDRGTP